MPSTFSPLLRTEMVATGDQAGSWSITNNTNIGTLLEQAIAGMANVAMLDADYTLTQLNGATDESRNMILSVTGTLTAARNVICPALSKVYVVRNSTTGGFAITIKTAAGTGVSVPNGAVRLVACDGVNVVAATFSAAEIINTPAGNIASTTVQAAINELDTEKAQITSSTGSVVVPSGTVAQRDTAPTFGFMRANDEYGQMEWWNGAAWIGLWGADNPTLVRYALANSFSKADTTAPAFTKTGAGTLSVKAGTLVAVDRSIVYYSVDTAITMPTLIAGTDYAVWVNEDSTIQATTSFTSAPSAGNWRMIGGFHYGLVAAGTTVAGGSFATTGNGMIWTQADVDKIAGINQFSVWDLKFRPAASDPRGMVLVDGSMWVDIYLCSTDTDANGTSKYNTNIASGTVLPKIPAAFGGNGVTTYPSLNWWVANELARANKKRLMFADEFATAMFGVTENQSIDATASTYPATLRNAGYTSKYGIEQASGHHWVWGQDSSAYQDVTGAGSWKQVTGNTGAAGSQRGETYTFGTYGLVRVILGGSRAHGANSGSRASLWSSYPWYSNWNIGLRAACDHYQGA